MNLQDVFKAQIEALTEPVEQELEDEIKRHDEDVRELLEEKK